MSSGSEIFGIISGAFGTLAVFSFIGGLLPRQQMRELKAQLNETRDMLDKALEEGRFVANEERAWREEFIK